MWIANGRILFDVKFYALHSHLNEFILLWKKKLLFGLCFNTYVSILSNAKKKIIEPSNRTILKWNGKPQKGGAQCSFSSEMSGNSE